MRKLLSAVCLTLALPVVALADPSTSPGYTAKDQEQFAKLGITTGTWTCKDDPPSKKPDVVTGKQAGNWYVWTESGDTPNTTYVRWDHVQQAYVQSEIDVAGGSMIATTKALDPFNATWKVLFPAHGPTSYPFKSTYADGTLTWTGQYPDPKTRKVQSYKAVCTKS